MSPNKVAEALRHIASKIERSQNPDRALVIKDITEVMRAVASDVAKPEPEKAAK